MAKEDNLNIRLRSYILEHSFRSLSLNLKAISIRLPSFLMQNLYTLIH